MARMNNIKIRTRLIGGFSVLLLLIAVLGGVSYTLLSGIHADVNDLVDTRMPQKEMLSVTYQDIRLSALYLRDALLAEDKAQLDNALQRLSESAAHSSANFDNLKKSLTTDKGKELYNTIMERRNANGDIRKQIVQLLKEGKKKEAIVSMEKMGATQSQYNRSVEDLDTLVKAIAKKKGEEASAEVRTGQLVAVGITLVAILFGVVSTILIVRSITAPLNTALAIANKVADGDLTVDIEATSADETGQLLAAMKNMTEKLKVMVSGIRHAAASVASGSDQLSASSEEITRTMSDQSSRSSQIAASTEEMSQTVIDIARNSASIATSANKTADIAQNGAEVVNKSVNESKAIAATVESSAKVMKNLGDKSKQIGEIISTINDIADQTNLLALNAAIEAARAGEQGRGFAVVADEVRKLAERTANATSEISSMITAIQGEVDNAVVAMNKTNEQVEVGLQYSVEAGNQLTTIVSSVTSLQGMVQQIATATEEMSTTSEAISGDIQQIATGASEISGGSEQVAQASSELARLAGELKGIVEQFKV